MEELIGSAQVPSWSMFDHGGTVHVTWHLAVGVPWLGHRTRSSSGLAWQVLERGSSGSPPLLADTVLVRHGAASLCVAQIHGEENDPNDDLLMISGCY